MSHYYMEYYFYGASAMFYAIQLINGAMNNQCSAMGTREPKARCSLLHPPSKQVLGSSRLTQVVVMDSVVTVHSIPLLIDEYPAA